MTLKLFDSPLVWRPGLVYLRHAGQEPSGVCLDTDIAGRDETRGNLEWP
jgi:hypothetical protein